MLIDKFQKLAAFLLPVKVPALVAGIFFFFGFLIVALTATSRRENYLLIPSVIGFLWTFSLYVFITTFHTLPAKGNGSIGFFAKVKRRLLRFWYWFLGTMFVGTTVAVVFTSYRMIAIWLKDYFG